MSRFEPASEVLYCQLTAWTGAEMAGLDDWMCNHFVFHSRTAYEDWPEPERRRHLLRLWVSHPDGPALPPNLSTEFQGSTGSGRPDGIRIPGVPLIAPLQPA